MKCNTFYEDQLCTCCFDSQGTDQKILNVPRIWRIKIGYVHECNAIENANYLYEVTAL